MCAISVGSSTAFGCAAHARRPLTNPPVDIAQIWTDLAHIPTYNSAKSLASAAVIQAVFKPESRHELAFSSVYELEMVFLTWSIPRAAGGRRGRLVHGHVLILPNSRFHGQVW